VADSASAHAGAGAIARATEPRAGRLSPAVLKDAGKRYVDDDLGDYAAALTYFGLMSLFPALLVGVGLLGLLGQESTVEDVVSYLSDRGAPEATVEAVRSSVETAVNSRAGASTLVLVAGLAVALYSASGWFAAAGRALNIVHCEDEDRGFVRRKATQLASTVVLIVLSVFLLVAVFLGGEVARELFDVIGLGRTAGAVWTWLRWPLALVVAMALVSYVYSVAPDRRRPFRLLTPGSVLAVVIWQLASAAFFFYVSNFGSYNATFGAFAGVVILLLWLYLTNVALLLGALVNEVLEGRARSSPAPTSTARPAPDTSRTARDVARK
jgi:membrane protein